MERARLLRRTVCHMHDRVCAFSSSIFPSLLLVSRDILPSLVRDRRVAAVSVHARHPNVFYYISNWVWLWVTTSRYILLGTRIALGFRRSAQLRIWMSEVVKWPRFATKFRIRAERERMSTWRIRICRQLHSALRVEKMHVHTRKTKMFLFVQTVFESLLLSPFGPLRLCISEDVKSFSRHKAWVLCLWRVFYISRIAKNEHEIETKTAEYFDYFLIIFSLFFSLNIPRVVFIRTVWGADRAQIVKNSFVERFLQLLVEYPVA